MATCFLRHGPPNVLSRRIYVAPFFSCPNESQSAEKIRGFGKKIGFGELRLYNHLAGLVDETKFAADRYSGQSLGKVGSKSKWSQVVIGSPIEMRRYTHLSVFVDKAPFTIDSHRGQPT